MHLIWRLVASLTLAGALTAEAKPQVTRIEPPLHVVFLGNSFIYYNNSLHSHLASLSRAADPEAAKAQTFKSITISGGPLSEHESGIEGILKLRKWNVVVLQGQSTEPMVTDKARSERFKDYARRYDRQIRESGARSVFFMTWAYRDKPEMYAPLAEGYEGIGNELGALVVPVGLAFERSIKARPALILHDADTVHPSLAGTYLAAATFYAALYGKTPVGNTYTAQLDPDTAKFLQGVAWETVNAYYELPAVRQ